MDDPEGGQDNLLNELELAFYNDGYRLARELNPGIGAFDKILTLTSEIFQTVEDFIGDFMQQCNETGSVIDCKKNCDWCCYQSVFILPHEAIFIYTRLTETLSKKEFEEIAGKINEKNLVTGKMKIPELIHHKKPCPFLLEKSCSIYPFRPVACRIHLSSSVKSCISEFYDSENMKIYPALYDLPLRAGRMMNQGFADALQEKGLNIFEWTIESFIDLLMKDPSIAKGWLQGKNLFQVRIPEKDEIAYLNKFNLGNNLLFQTKS